MTFPLAVDPRRVPIVLVGRGEAAARRLAWLDAGGAGTAVFSDAPGPALAAAAGVRLIPRLPGPDDFPARGFVLVAGLDDAAAERIAALARAAGALVNVEDSRALCDFHLPAVVRRGDLVVAVSTGGRSPGTASRVRRLIDEWLPADWAGRLDRIAALRGRLRLRGASARDVARATDALIDRELAVPRRDAA